LDFFAASGFKKEAPSLHEGLKIGSFPRYFFLAQAWPDFPALLPRRARHPRRALPSSSIARKTQSRT
jgi:hypothetical protein